MAVRPVNSIRAEAELRPAPSLISVVVPVRDAAQTLPEQLAALSRQRYTGRWEVLVVDNGSRDGSAAVARRWADGEPHARVIEAPGGAGAAHVRNAGVRAARGDFIAFCDADDVADPDWLSAIARVATSADIVAGRHDYDRVNQPLVRSWHKDRPADRPPDVYGFLPFASSSNAGIWRDVFEALGGFDEGTASGEDVDLCWRAQLASFTLAFAADAVVHFRYRPTLAGLAAQYYKYGKGDAWLFARYAEAGMPARGLREGLGRWWLLLRGVRHLRSTPSHLGRWLQLAAVSAGRLAGSIRQRRLYL